MEDDFAGEMDTEDTAEETQTESEDQNQEEAETEEELQDEDSAEDEDYADEDGVEEEEEVGAAPKKNKSAKGAEKRIRGLIAENKANKENMAAMQQQLQSVYEQYQESKHSLDKDLQLTKRELELTREWRQKKEEENLDPGERLKRNIERDTMAKLEKRLMPEIGSIKEQFKKQEEARQSERAEIERRERMNSYQQDTTSAISKLLEKADSKYTKPLKEDLSHFILNWMAITGQSAEYAAKKFDKIASMYVSSKRSVKNKKDSAALNKSQNTPQSIPTKKRTAKGGEKMPSNDELAKAGFPNLLEWMAAQDKIGD